MMMQSFDTRSTVDCKYFLAGTCAKGSACPFRHDSTKISAVRGQSQPDCVFFLGGRCTKGALCPFKHDQAKLLALRGGAMPAAAPSVSAPAAVQPITVDFGPSSSSPDARAAMQPPQPAFNPATQAAAAAGVRQPPAAARAPDQQLHARVAQQQPRQQQLRQQQKPLPQQPRRSEPEAQPGLSVPSRLAGRLGPITAAQPMESPERQSPKRARDGRQAERGAAGEAQRMVGGRAAAAERPVRRRGGGALGVAVAALQGALGRDVTPDAEAGDGNKLLRTIVVDQPQRKRRLGGEEQSVKFAVDEEPRLASPPRAKKQAVAARASGPGPSHPRAGTASPTAASAPRQPERQPEHPADSGGSKPEPTEFQPPKSLQELRKVRQQRSTSSQERPVQSSTYQKAVHSRPSKHKPILWQPEAGQAPAGPQQGSSKAATAAGSPLAAPQASAGVSIPAQQPAAAEAAAEAAPAAAQSAALAAAGVDARQEELEEQADEENLELEEEEELEGMDADAGDEDDDFEAQMRALEEQL